MAKNRGLRDNGAVPRPEQRNRTKTPRISPLLRQDTEFFVDSQAVPRFTTACYRDDVSWRVAGPYIVSAYCLTIRRALKRGVTEMIASLTTCSQRRGIPFVSRS